MAEAHDRPWMAVVSLSLKVGLALAIAYAAYDFFTRPSASGKAAKQREESPLQADLYVYPSKTHISSYATAGKLAGMDLWTKEGWRWAASPGERWLAPLEKVTPTRVYEQGGELRIGFEKDGQASWLTVGAGGQVYVDEMFFIEDPRELYGHWSEEDWRRIGEHEAWVGMSEFQAVFSLGSGRPLDVSPGGQTRIVEFAGRPGAEAVTITFRDLIATEVR